MRKVGGLIEAARSSAGRVARPDREQQRLTGDILAALEISIEQSHQSVLKDLQILEQETELSEGQEGPRAKSKEAEPDSAKSGHSENNSTWGDPNGFKAEMDNSAFSSAIGQSETKSEGRGTQGVGDKERGSADKRNGMDALQQLRPSAQVIDPPEAGRNGDREIPAQEGLNASNGPAMKPLFCRGNITLVILLKKASDESTIHLTPEHISRQIKNTPGGSVVDAGMLGKEYFIKARFETPVSLHEVLDGVSDWEDFEHQSDKVIGYQKRAWAIYPSSSSKDSKDEKRVLVTL